MNRNFLGDILYMEWEQWPDLPLSQRAALPTHPGIYVVVDAENQVWYVGLSRNLNARWNGRGHHRYKQLSRTNNKRLYKICWQLCPVEQLAAQEHHYIDLFKPHLNYSRVRTYAKRAIQPHQEISRLLKVINQKNMMFPDVRSVVLGYYVEVDEDEENTLKKYTSIVIAINVNDHDRPILNSYLKSESKKGISLKDCWVTYESNCGSDIPDAKPVLIPVFLSADIAYEFVCHFRLLDKLEQDRASLHTVELARQSVLALRDTDSLPALLAAENPKLDYERYLHYRAADLRPIAELLTAAETV